MGRWAGRAGIGASCGARKLPLTCPLRDAAGGIAPHLQVCKFKSGWTAPTIADAILDQLLTATTMP